MYNSIILKYSWFVVYDLFISLYYVINIFFFKKEKYNYYIICLLWKCDIRKWLEYF